MQSPHVGGPTGSPTEYYETPQNYQQPEPELSRADHAMIIGLEEILRRLDIIVEKSEKIRSGVSLLVFWFVILPLIVMLLWILFLGALLS